MFFFSFILSPFTVGRFEDDYVICLGEIFLVVLARGWSLVVSWNLFPDEKMLDLGSKQMDFIAVSVLFDREKMMLFRRRGPLFCNG